jgi:sulfonate transport system ATP-binding protein
MTSSSSKRLSGTIAHLRKLSGATIVSGVSDGAGTPPSRSTRWSLSPAEVQDRDPASAAKENVAISFSRATKAYPPGSNGNGLLAVYQVSLDIRKGEFVSLIGPSGCGKSTLLNIAAGLLHPTAGAVLCDGEPVSAINTKIGYLTQHSTLLPWRTVEKNVSVPLEIQGVPRAERRERIASILRLVGLSKFAHHYPAQLSGGMLRRLALARMLVYGPEILLMDEPFGALDAQLRTELQRELLRIWEHETKTVLFVTHDIEEAIVLSDRIVVLAANPGRVLHEESIDFARPRDIGRLRTTDGFHRVQDRLWTLLESATTTGSPP